MQSWQAMVENHEKLLGGTNSPQGISLDLNRSYYDSLAQQGAQPLFVDVSDMQAAKILFAGDGLPSVQRNVGRA
jgi:hypothetical protein